MTDDATRQDKAVTGAPESEWRRNALLTTGIVLAIAGVWAFALGVLDNQSPETDPSRYGVTMRTRTERRPVLFVVTAPADEVATGTSYVNAVAIARVDPGGVLRPPIPRTTSPEERAREMRAFAENYYATDVTLELLRGGAAAETLRIAGDARLSDELPTARLTDASADRIPAVEREEVLLALSDRRVGGTTSGVRPMREAHQSNIEQLTRRLARERFPGLQVDTVDVERLRVADLNRDGQAELLASVAVTLRADGRQPSMARLFLIAEPASNGDPEAPYRAGFVSVSRESDSRPADQMTFVDQVDLTPDAYDEVVVASRMRDGTQYLVLQRRDAGWMEIFASDVVTLPALQPGG